LELDLVNVENAWMTSLHRNKSAGKVYRPYLLKKHSSLLPKYIKSVFGLLPCYCIFTCSQITLLQQKKNEAPNHDTGCGPSNNHQARSWHHLQSVPIGQSSTTVRPELFCQRL